MAKQIIEKYIAEVEPEVSPIEMAEPSPTDLTGRAIIKPDELRVTKFIFEQISHHAQQHNLDINSAFNRVFNQLIR